MAPGLQLGAAPALGPAGCPCTSVGTAPGTIGTAVPGAATGLPAAAGGQRGRTATLQPLWGWSQEPCLPCPRLGVFPVTVGD